MNGRYHTCDVLVSWYVSLMLAKRSVLRVQWKEFDYASVHKEKYVKHLLLIAEDLCLSF